MNTMSLTTLDRGKTTVDAAAIEALSAQLRGTLLQQGDAAYDEVRAIWNATVDRRPGLIVCCVGASDVIRAVNFARENRLLVSVRGGGHNIAGSAVCDGGLMIDRSAMNSSSSSRVMVWCSKASESSTGRMVRQTSAWP